MYNEVFWPIILYRFFWGKEEETERETGAMKENQFFWRFGSTDLRWAMKKSLDYLAVFVRVDFELDFPEFVIWPKAEPPTLGSYGVFAYDSPDWESYAKASDEHMAAFRDPTLLPKSGDQKRQCLDLKSYRLRGASDTFATIMAAYTSQADIELSRLKQAGLYGALIAYDRNWTSARYLLAVEAYILLGGCGCVNTVLPLDRKQQFRILGNAIATPHALICWINGLLLFPDRMDDPPNVIDLFQTFFRVAWKDNRLEVIMIS